MLPQRDMPLQAGRRPRDGGFRRVREGGDGRGAVAEAAFTRGAGGRRPSSGRASELRERPLAFDLFGLVGSEGADLAEGVHLVASPLDTGQGPL